jgi:hypothetical protein
VCQNALGILYNHRKKRGQEHPKYASGSAYHNSRTNTEDITYTERSRKCKRKRTAAFFIPERAKKRPARTNRVNDKEKPQLYQKIQSHTDYMQGRTKRKIHNKKRPHNFMYAEDF